MSESHPVRPAKIETVLLDAGGVLLDLDYDYLRRLLDARGFEVSRDELAVLEARARVEIERRVRDSGRVGEAWRDYFRSILGRAAVPPDHHEAIVDSLWERERTQNTSVGNGVALPHATLVAADRSLVGVFTT